MLECLGRVYRTAKVKVWTVVIVYVTKPCIINYTLNSLGVLHLIYLYVDLVPILAGQKKSKIFDIGFCDKQQHQHVD